MALELMKSISVTFTLCIGNRYHLAPSRSENSHAYSSDVVK
ncbi:hypothetical protein SB00059_05167 [Klebsiella quasipneumoniae subsp. quasipneumoniae]|nr:hypothetical protein SB00059_05167 [Klebsiella quasipneumoniae subsp. quasipneumoniae]